MTTWLYQQLKEHPDIYVPETKELHFFNKYNSNLYEKNHFQLGMNWYKNFFRNYRGEKAIGEVTPMYICDRYAPERIRETLPNIKMIAVLRNPVDRAYSHYWMAKSKKHTQNTFEEVVNNKQPKFIERGLYYEQLQRYYELFDKEQILILLADDFYNNKENSLQKVFRFLDVNTNYISNDTEKKVNKTGAYRSPFLYNLITKSTHALRKSNRTGKLVDFTKKIGLADFIMRKNRKEFQYPEIPNDLKHRLIAYYKPHNENLQKLINRDIQHWNY